MLKKGLMVAAVVVVGLGAFIASRPSTFEVKRSQAVTAAPEVVFAQVNDFHQWAAWSPWEKLDPTMKKEFSGPEAGEGATYHWVGNDQVGEGRMTITSVKPNEQVDIKLEFLKPWEAVNQTVFTLTPTGETTEVTWSMSGENTFMGKAMSLFMNMDSMIGKDFEKGLAELKQVSEAEQKKRAEAATAEAAATPTPEGTPAGEMGDEAPAAPVATP